MENIEKKTEVYVGVLTSVHLDASRKKHSTARQTFSPCGISRLCILMRAADSTQPHVKNSATLNPHQSAQCGHKRAREHRLLNRSDAWTSPPLRDRTARR